MCQKSPIFMFWNFILRYERLILIFVMAHRVKIFSLYVFRSYGKTYTSIFYLRSCQLFKMGTFSHWRHEILARFHQSLVREARPLGSI